jgi:hypothetical protein
LLQEVGLLAAVTHPALCPPGLLQHFLLLPLVSAALQGRMNGLRCFCTATVSHQLLLLVLAVG